MTLFEMSGEYRAEAEALRERIALLRQERKHCPETEKIRLECRISALTAIQRETRELAMHLEHYYERGYCRNEKYTL